MPGTQFPDGDGGRNDSPRLSLWERLVWFVRFRGRRPDAVPLSDRMSSTFLKPPKPGAAPADVVPDSVEELEATIKYANDKERIIGLIAAPVAAAIGFIITTVLISNDPAPLLADGKPNKLHVSVGLYHEVLIALLALSVVMMITALLRKRLFLGIVTALFGLTVFNLHYWGFGVPFLMCGSWLLVRSYRLQRALREATGDVQPRSGGGARATGSGSRPRANKRYTPPTS